MTLERDSTLSLGRREVLATTGVIITGATAGCSDLPLIGQPSLADLPPFKEGWAAVRQDGSADVILRFDGDVQQKMEEANVSEEDLVGTGDIEVSQESVQIARTPDIPSQQTVEGSVEGFVEIHTNWPGARWYFTGLVSLDEEVPLVENPKFHVRFPSGYEYEFPTDQRRVIQGPVDVNRGEDKALVSYGEDSTYPRNRTIPFIDHYDYSALVWMRAYAEYRHRLLTQTIPLFDWDQYAQNMAEALRSGVSEVASYLAENAVTSIITSGIPSSQATAALSKFEDLQSVHDALTQEYDDFQAALESLSTLTYASVNETWMSVLTPDDGGGLPRLQTLSEIEWKNRNPVLATAHDQERFAHQLDEYQTLLDDQRSITQGILSDAQFTDISAFGDDEWRQLKRRAEQLVRRLDTHIGEEQAALETLRSEFS